MQTIIKKYLRIDRKKIDPMEEFIGKLKSKGKIDGVKEINKYYQRKGLKISG